MRLDKAVASQGHGSRKSCRALIESGRVLVNGVAATDPDAEVDTAGLQLTVSGQRWPFAERLVLMLNKPLATECSHAPTHHPSVFSLLPAPFVARGVQAVGRLDADTSGLLLFTDDGKLLQQLTSPRRHVAKRYRVECAAAVTDAQLQQLEQGVRLVDDPVPARGRAARLTDRVIELELDEGRYHQVRRMLVAVGNHVTALQRTRIGALDLPADLSSGSWRLLDDAALALVTV